jgi:hypothetical protein
MLAVAACSVSRMRPCIHTQNAHIFFVMLRLIYRHFRRYFGTNPPFFSHGDTVHQWCYRGGMSRKTRKVPSRSHFFVDGCRGSFVHK